MRRIFAIVIACLVLGTASPGRTPHAARTGVQNAGVQSASASVEPAKAIVAADFLSSLPKALIEATEEEEEYLLSDMDPATLRMYKQQHSPARAPHFALSTPDHYASRADSTAVAAQAVTSFANFAGVDDSQNTDGYIHTPPDTHIAIGPAHVVTVVNALITIYNKSGTKLSSANFQAWFSSVCGCPAPGFTDPRITYDPVAGRFLLVELYNDFTAGRSRVLVSISRSSDPTGLWWNFNLDGALLYNDTENTFADFPDIGFDGIAAADGGAVYITTNQFTFSGSSFRTASVHMLPKSALYTGGGFTYWRVWNLLNADGTTAFSMRATKTYGDAGAEYLVNTKNNGSTLSTWRANPTYPPVAIDFSLQSTLNIGAYAVAPDASQPGTTDLVSTGDNRLYESVWRNDRLYTAFNEAYNWGAGTVSALRHLRMNTATNSVEFNETFGADTLHYFCPAIAIDAAGDEVVQFSRSGASEFAGARYVTRATVDLATQSSVPLKAGTVALAKRTGTSAARWGDYGGIALDPADGSRVWVYGEYATPLAGIANDFMWGTWIGGLQFPVVLPPTIVATAESTTSVTITWTQPAGGLSPARYRVFRTANNASYTQVNGETTTSTSFTDTAASPGTAYLYKVRAVDGLGNESVDSNRDLAATVMFTDATVTARATRIKAAHIAELRTAVNAVRVLAAIGQFTFADASIASSRVKAVHLVELRAALAAARAALGITARSYTDPTIAAATTTVRAVHITELRNGVR